MNNLSDGHESDYDEESAIYSISNVTALLIWSAQLKPTPPSSRFSIALKTIGGC